MGGHFRIENEICTRRLYLAQLRDFSFAFVHIVKARKLAFCRVNTVVGSIAMPLAGHFQKRLMAKGKEGDYDV